MTAPLLVLTLTMILIAVQRLPGVQINRPAGALTGAVLMLLATDLTLEQASAAVHLPTLALLLGLMIVARYLEEGGWLRGLEGGLSRCAIHAPRTLAPTVALAAGMLSALLMNDTVCLALTPLLTRVCLRTGIAPIRPLIALILGSNVGSLMLPLGNPQQAFIALQAPMTFNGYAAALAPLGGLLLGATALVLWLLPLHRSDPIPACNPELEPDAPGRPNRLVPLIALGLLGALLAGADMTLAVLTAAALLLLLGGASPDRMLARIDWPLLLMFAGLFVVMEGVVRSGAPESLWQTMAPWMGGEGARPLIVLGLTTLIGSNLVSNVPFVMLAAPWIPPFADPQAAWRVLAAISTLAGNLALTGSMAALIVAEAARKQGVILGFWPFFRVGAPLTLLTCTIAMAWFI
ncbi:MAG: anion transporter [Alphaproteobacteria bacterium CG_4_10_14_0_2_um_filter_63_37]|nr:MAG: hypothetical protein AUJ55_01660 [Proteobacteria bacterium CG1_02_64_396]PJA24901.1 MAG: anion transporter [Alphaproteobacteria bacterium CG_4_10_14_0_2_um_filter_63_37]